MDWTGYDIIENLRGEKLGKERLAEWGKDSHRQIQCVFCGVVGTETYFSRANFLCCPRCKEYKGLQPYIEEWSD